MERWVGFFPPEGISPSGVSELSLLMEKAERVFSRWAA